MTARQPTIPDRRQPVTDQTAEPYVRVTLTDIYKEVLTLGGKVDRSLDRADANAKDNAALSVVIGEHGKVLDSLKERKYVTPMGLWLSITTAIAACASLAALLDRLGAFRA